MSRSSFLADTATQALANGLVDDRPRLMALSSLPFDRTILSGPEILERVRMHHDQGLNLFGPMVKAFGSIHEQLSALARSHQLSLATSLTCLINAAGERTIGTAWDEIVDDSRRFDDPSTELPCDACGATGTSAFDSALSVPCARCESTGFVRRHR